MRLSSIELDETGIGALRNQLAGEVPECAAALVSHVEAIGAKFLVMEEPYIDRDYSSDFAGFYASAFKPYPRHTKRLHLFASDPRPILSGDLATQAAATGEELGYLGFVVVRPIRHGPIGRTVLPFPRSTDGLVVRAAARSEVEVGLRATRLKAKGAPFIQQERKIGACAQAAIWMASRPIHERHRLSSWHSVTQITALATTPTDAVLSQALPHGSEGLNPIHITRALRGMGHQPLCDQFAAAAAQGGTQHAIDALGAVIPYLDSGLPVILGLPPETEDQLGHAVTAVGYVETDGPALRAGSGYDRFVRAVIVHDDQNGPYRLMALTAADAVALADQPLLVTADGSPLTLDASPSHMFVPMSPRVFLRADHASIIADDFVTTKTEDMRTGLIAQVEATVPEARARMERFCDDVERGRVVLRTYLTTAGKYRHYLAAGGAAEDLKFNATTITLPHFVYVTELIREDATPDEQGARAVVGHIVFNATSSTDLNADLLFAHLPHLAFVRDLDCDPAERDYDERIILISEERPYAQRLRS